MTATNHALTGALIGLTVSNPVVALIAALTSHFILDALPHFGDDHHRLKLKLNGSLFQTMLFSDIGLCLVIALALFTVQPTHWFMAIVCAFIATSPDFAWFADYRAALKHHPRPKRGAFRRFASAIQWSQTPEGALVEVVWTLTMASLLYAKLV